MGRLSAGRRKIGDFSWPGEVLPELVRKCMCALLQIVFVVEDAYASLLLLMLHKYRFQYMEFFTYD